MAASIQNLLVETAKKERLENEIGVARTIQQKLLPPPEARLGGVGVLAHFAPVAEIGGDYYDYLTMPDGRLDGARLRQAGLAEVDWERASLRGADLTGASLKRAQLGGADLTGVTVIDTDFDGADLASTKLIAPIGLGQAKNFDKARNSDRLIR